MHIPILIVGGGMAGMSAALTLADAGKEFCLVTETLGGRVLYSPEARVNYGAYYLMANYRYARRILTPETRLQPLRVLFHNSPTERFPLLHPHTLVRLPELARFYRALRQFMAHYEQYKTHCLTMTQKQALEADPYLAARFVQPAAEFIRERGFPRAAADYVSKFTYACTGVSPEGISAFDFLNVSQGLIVPIYRFRFDLESMARSLGGRLALDSITGLAGQQGSYTLQGRSGQSYTAEQVILATPAAVTQKLLDLPEIRSACSLYLWHVRGTLKPVFRKYELNLFSPASEIMLTAREWDGSYLIYSRSPQADLGQVCEQYEMICRTAWEKAMYVKGSAYLEQQFAPGLFVAGDHNGLGLEPAAISGIYAANQAMAKG